MEVGGRGGNGRGVRVERRGKGERRESSRTRGRDRWREIVQATVDTIQ